MEYTGVNKKPNRNKKKWIPSARELKTKPIYEFRCDERLKTKVEESTRLACTVVVHALLVVYYEPLLLRLKTKVEESTRLACTAVVVHT